MRIFVAGLSLILGGCVFLKDGRRSQWRELDAAKDVACTRIPVQKDDLGIVSLHTLKGPQGVSLFSVVKKRSGSQGFYAATFDGQPLKAASLRSYALPAQAKVVGGGLRADKKIVAVAIPQAGDEASEAKSTVQLYREQGTPEWSPITLPGSFEGGQFSLVEGGYWLTLRQANHYQVGYFREPTGAAAVKPQWMTSLFRYQPTLLPSGTQGAAYAIYLDEKNQKAESAEDFAVIEKDFNQYLTTLDAEDPKKQVLESEEEEAAADASDEDGSFEFRLRHLSGAGPGSEPVVLDLPTAAGVELWSIKGDATGFKLAYVEGDSLAGRATLHIAAFSMQGGGQAKRLWLNSFSLADVHVSDLDWLTGGSSERLIFLKWVDGERTIAGYELGASGAQAMAPKGIFPVDAAIIDSFALRVDGQQEAFAIMRTKDRFLWQFEMCQLGGL